MSLDQPTPFATSTRFAHRHIHLGVSGSISCYKALELLRSWLRLEIHVAATLTEGARQFITPLLLESLGAMPVYGGMFAPGQEPFAHLEPGQQAELMMLAPATADLMARMATGRSDDMLAAQILAFDGPVIVAPAMNPRMWDHKATQANVQILRQRGVQVLEPDAGTTACGDTGRGRLAGLSTLFLAGLKALAPQDMAGLKVMVTLGPTREAWDGVRYWTNPSTGRMGAELAVAAWLRGAEVTAVCGPGVQFYLPQGIRLCPVRTAAEMFAAARNVWAEMDMGIFCAAVADFSPRPVGAEKFKKSSSPQGFEVTFTPNVDILQTLSARARPDQKILGFAAETTPDMAALLPLAHAKLAGKKAHLLAANRVNAPDSGFASSTNSMAIVDCTGKEALWPVQSKADVAWDLCSWLLQI